MNLKMAIIYLHIFFLQTNKNKENMDEIKLTKHTSLKNHLKTL